MSHAQISDSDDDRGMSMRVWFQLVDAHGAMLGLTADYVDVPPKTIMASVRKEIARVYKDSIFRQVAPNNVCIFASRAAFDEMRPLDIEDLMDGLGVFAREPIVVRVPSTSLEPSLAQTTTIPPHSVFPDSEAFRVECAHLGQWAVGAAHPIPKISEFMERLGGCTKTGKVFWREEEKQVASLLLHGWLEPLSDYKNMKSIVVGSPGVGKSTMLCLLAFYVVFTCKKSVLVYRQLLMDDQQHCLFYMGLEEDRFVNFSVENCSKQTAASIYSELRRRPRSSDLWLFLDGFIYSDIPEGLETFKMLATSQQADLKSQAAEHAYCCLHPCWKKNDLVAFAASVCGWDEETAEERFFYAGGSVREFTRTTVDQIKNLVFAATSKVEDSSLFLSKSGAVMAGPSQVDRLRRTFVRDAHVPHHYLFMQDWVQVIDSEYAILLLLDRLRASTVQRLFQWARAGGPQYASLAGSLFEILVHRLAAEGALCLTASSYHQLPLRAPKTDRVFDFHSLRLQSGHAVRSGTATDYESALRKWRDNDSSSYWFPACHDFPNIGSIVKLKTDERGGEAGDKNKKAVRVAYLQVTVGSKHSIDGKQLKIMNAIFHPTAADKKLAPIYVAVCPSEADCRELTLLSRPAVVHAQKQCDVYVGFAEERDLAIAANAPLASIKEESTPEKPTYLAVRSRERQHELLKGEEETEA